MAAANDRGLSSPMARRRMARVTPSLHVAVVLVDASSSGRVRDETVVGEGPRRNPPTQKIPVGRRAPSKANRADTAAWTRLPEISTVIASGAGPGARRPRRITCDLN